MESFVNADTDGDGILDWEEILQGTNPTKRDSDDDGVDDRAQMAAERGLTEEELEAEEANLTQTEKLSRELFATTVSLSQIGEIDADTVEKIAESITAQVDSVPEKVYVLSELNISADNSGNAMGEYIASIENIYKKYPTPPTTVLDVMAEFAGDGQTENVEALSQLEPIVEQTKNVILEMTKIKVPGDLASLHLDMINNLQRLNENVDDMLLFEFDPIVAMGGFSKYEENIVSLEGVLAALQQKIMLYAN